MTYNDCVDCGSKLPWKSMADRCFMCAAIKEERDAKEKLRQEREQ